MSGKWFDSNIGASAPLSTEEDFELVRRLDWRFLLPDPALRRVIYWGPEPDPLLEALRRFTDITTVMADIDSTGGPSKTEVFDLAVVRSVDAAPIRRIRRLLAPGAAVYWEPVLRPSGAAIGLSSRARFGFLSSARTLEGSLITTGFENISINWHYPDIETARFVIKLNDHAPAVHLMAGRAPWAPVAVQRITARAFCALLSVFPKVGMSSVVAQRSDVPGGHG